jgi:hypothetical protein
LTDLDAFVQLIIRTHLCEMYIQDPKNPYTSKHNCIYLLQTFDSLHAKEEYQHLTIKDFPERVGPKAMRLRYYADINDNSDASIGDRLYDKDKLHGEA